MNNAAKLPSMPSGAQGEICPFCKTRIFTCMGFGQLRLIQSDVDTGKRQNGYPENKKAIPATRDGLSRSSYRGRFFSHCKVYFYT